MIQIYRYGHYINAVRGRDALTQWLRDNIIPHEGESLEDKPLPALLLIAGQRNYSFTGLRRR